MVTRNQLFQEFKKQNEGFAPLLMMETIFKTTTDEQLAKSFNLKVLRRGRFVN